MNHYEIRDPDEARLFVAQDLWLSTAGTLNEPLVANALSWSLEIAAQGEPIPPVGIVLDLGRLLQEPRWSGSSVPRSRLEVPGWPAGLSRAYEDVVLGKLDADPTFARASDALARCRGRDFARGLAFVVDRLRARTQLGGVVINPVALKPESSRLVSQFLEIAWESLEQSGPLPMLVDLYQDWVKAIRDLADALAPEDVFELEHGTALASFGQRIALRQVLQAANDFETSAPIEKPRATGSRPEVATRFLDEDTYPVGGFSSISTRGSIESLLHSQLVFMEDGERPDPFDIKFVRDELLYYSRDENQFLRRRRTFLFILWPDLARARVKDPDLPRQRIILILGLIVATIHRLTDWLGDDSLTFEIVFIDNGSVDPLEHEQELINLILGEAIARGEVITSRMPSEAVVELASSRGQRSLCHALMISTRSRRFEAETAVVSTFNVADPIPDLQLDQVSQDVPQAVETIKTWRTVFGQLLGFWI